LVGDKFWHPPSRCTRLRGGQALSIVKGLDIFDVALQADGECEVRVNGLKHQKEKRGMDHFAELDVSLKGTSVCIVDDAGKIVREVKVASEPQALLAVLKNPAYHIKRIGLEAGPLSQWLFSALTEADMRDLLLRVDSSRFRHDHRRQTSGFTKNY
jgi:hypothetical protein